MTACADYTCGMILIRSEVGIAVLIVISSLFQGIATQSGTL